MKLSLVSDDVHDVIAVHPLAYCACDQDGFYIVSEKEVVGAGRRPKKAWAKAAELVRKQRKGKSSKK